MDIKKMIVKFAKQWSLNLKMDVNFEQFTEFFYRRNVFIHNNGFPDQWYRDMTGNKGSNEKLELSDDYLLQLIEVFSSYSDTIYEYFLEKECSMVNITKKGNSHHIDGTNGRVKIIPIKDEKQ